MMAVLLLHSNRRVSVDRLTASLWQGSRPVGSRKRAHLCIGPAPGTSASQPGYLPQLEFERGGYQLNLVPSELDLLVFEDLEQRGRRAFGSGDFAEASQLLWEALRLWRGQPAEDVIMHSDEAATIAGLEERRLAVEEAWIDAQLAQGLDEELIGQLRIMVAAQPLREQLWHRLMVALYRSGRSADALAAFQELRQRVVGELGIEPGPQVQRLQRQILAGEVPDARSTVTVTQRQFVLGNSRRTLPISPAAPLNSTG